MIFLFIFCCLDWPGGLAGPVHGIARRRSRFAGSLRAQPAAPGRQSRTRIGRCHPGGSRSWRHCQGIFFFLFFSANLWTFLHLYHQPPTPKLVPFFLLFKKKFNYSNQDWFYLLRFSFLFWQYLFSLLFDLGGVVDEAKRKGNSSREFLSFFISNNLENISCVGDLIPFKVIPDDPFFYFSNAAAHGAAGTALSLSLLEPFSLWGHNP